MSDSQTGAFPSDPMIDSYMRERAAIKTLLEIRKIVSIAPEIHGCMIIIEKIDDLLDRCGYTHIPGGNG